MVVSASPASARLGARLRFGLLLAVALLTGHDAVYAAQHGLGQGFATAMTSLGHDSWWGSFTIAAILAGAGLVAGSLTAIHRLQRRLDRIRGDEIPTPDGVGDSAPYRVELMRLWTPLFAAVTLLFAFQENVETFLSRGEIPGIDVLLGSGLPMPALVLGVVSLTLAAVGALVRWRIASLRSQLSSLPRGTRPRPSRSRPAREWADIHASALHRWILDRCDAGRAPPVWIPA